jgi:hypothetical protein
MRLVASTAVLPVWQKHRVLSNAAINSRRYGLGRALSSIVFISFSYSHLMSIVIGYETQSNNAGNTSSDRFFSQIHNE